MKYPISNRSIGVGNNGTQKDSKLKMNSSAIAFYRFLEKKYKNVGDRELIELDTLLNNYACLSILDRLQRVKSILAPLKLKTKESQRESFEESQIVSMAGYSNLPRTLLNIGSNEDVIEALGVPRDKAYTLNLEESKDTMYTSLSYINNTIPLKDKSVDIIIITRILHHIHPNDREVLLKEIRRISADNVKIIVQENDNDNSTKLYYNIDLYYLYYSIIDDTSVKDLHLFSQIELQKLFHDTGFGSLIVITPSGWQRMYWSCYELNTIEDPIVVDSFQTNLKYRLGEDYAKLEAIKIRERQHRFFNDSYLRLTFESPRLSYHERPVVSDVIKIGQLKLLIHHMQVILENWNPIKNPKLTVVYACAAPGHNFEVLSKLFKGIQWHLYDPAEFVIKNSNTIHLYSGDKEGYFTDETAALWAGKDVFFFSDIRPRDFDKTDPLGFTTVNQNMRQQERWTTIIQPLTASLKLRLPYSYETEIKMYPYLAGEILPQPFGPFGSEARLIPSRDEHGNYHMRDYDIVAYEDIMFYFQSVTREDMLFSNPLVEACTDLNRGCLDPLVESKEYQVIQDDELDNHFDSVYYLRIIKMYSDFVTKYPQVGSVNVSLMTFAKDVLKKLFSLFSKQMSIKIARQRVTKYRND